MALINAVFTTSHAGGNRVFRVAIHPDSKSCHELGDEWCSPAKGRIVAFVTFWFSVCPERSSLTSFQYPPRPRIPGSTPSCCCCCGGTARISSDGSESLSALP